MKIDIFDMAEVLRDMLEKRGVEFNEYGFPMLTKKMLLANAPSLILPYVHRKAYKKMGATKENTVLCFFEEDTSLYRHIKKLDSIIRECRGYMGMVDFDLSPCIAWDKKQQVFNMLLSAMLTAYIATSGVKVIPNWRTGEKETLKFLGCYPKNTIFGVGSRGSSHKPSVFSRLMFRQKVLVSWPRSLLYYGPVRDEYAAVLDDYGIPYKHYDDFATMSRKLSKVGA